MFCACEVAEGTGDDAEEEIAGELGGGGDGGVAFEAEEAWGVHEEPFEDPVAGGGAGEAGAGVFEDETDEALVAGFAGDDLEDGEAFEETVFDGGVAAPEEAIWILRVAGDLDGGAGGAFDAFEPVVGDDFGELEVGEGAAGVEDWGVLVEADGGFAGDGGVVCGGGVEAVETDFAFLP